MVVSYFHHEINTNSITHMYLLVLKSGRLEYASSSLHHKFTTVAPLTNKSHIIYVCDEPTYLIYIINLVGPMFYFISYLKCS